MEGAIAGGDGRADAVRVALVVGDFPAFSETFVVSRALGLIDRGWDLHVVCEAINETAWSAYPSARARLRGRCHVRPRVRSRLRLIILFVATLLRLTVHSPVRMIGYLTRGLSIYGRGLVRRFVDDAPLIALGPEIVHFEFAALAKGREFTGALLKSRVVVSVQGYDVSYIGLGDPNYYSSLWRQVDAVHAVSHGILGRAQRRGLPEDAFARVVYNGLDTATFSDASRHHVDVTGTPTRPLCLLSVGRLHWQKGFDFALQAVRRLVDEGYHMEYRIVGDGDMRDALLYSIHDLGLENTVRLVGSCGADEVRVQLRWADVLVHPAISEGFCIAVAEAQAMGIPVVVSDAQGLRENVEDTITGFVVPRRDPAQLSRRLGDLARDPALRDRMGRAGAERVRSLFTIENHVEGISEIYRAVALLPQRSGSIHPTPPRVSHVT